MGFNQRFALMLVIVTAAGLPATGWAATASQVQWVGSLLGGNQKGVAVEGNYAYVAGGKVLTILDITTPAAPSQAGYFEIPGGNASKVTVVASYAYVPDSTTGLHILDVSNPAAPTQAGLYTCPGSVQDVAIRGNYAYVLAASPNTLRVVDISTPGSPTDVGSASVGGVGQRPGDQRQLRVLRALYHRDAGRGHQHSGRPGGHGHLQHARIRGPGRGRGDHGLCGGLRFRPACD